MSFYLTGIDYKRASLKEREALYRKRREITFFWELSAPSRAAILFTCNRVEVYGSGRASPGYFHKGYTILGREEVVRHALRVACGLESQIKGEPQILNQVKAWRSQKNFPSKLAGLWDGVISAAEEIRAKSGLADQSRNIAGMIREDILRHIERPAAVIIGTGKIAELFSCMRPAACVGLYFVANKNHARAEMLAKRSGGKAISFRELPGALVQADAVISATSSPHLVLGKDGINGIFARRERPLYIYDLALPRDVDPDIGSVPGIILRDLDDLTGLSQKYNERIERNLKLAEYLVEEKIKEGEFNEEDIENRRAAEQAGR